MANPDQRFYERIDMPSEHNSVNEILKKEKIDSIKLQNEEPTRILALLTNQLSLQYQVASLANDYSEKEIQHRVDEQFTFLLSEITGEDQKTILQLVYGSIPTPGAIYAAPLCLMTIDLSAHLNKLH